MGKSMGKEEMVKREQKERGRELESLMIEDKILKWIKVLSLVIESAASQYS